MASKAFLELAKKARQTKDLSELLVGSSSTWMAEGEHDVVIQAVDSSDLDNDKLTVTFVNSEGKEYVDRLFTLTVDKDGFSWGIRRVFSGVLPNEEALTAFLDEAATDPEAFNMLTGMKLKVFLNFGNGFIVRMTDERKFVAIDNETKAEVSGYHDQAQEARDEANAKGLKRAFLRIKKTEATHAESNAAILYVAIEGKRRAKAPKGGII